MIHGQLMIHNQTEFDDTPFCLEDMVIVPDKTGDPHIIFLISAQKHMLEVLIRSVLLMSTFNICFHAEKRIILVLFR